MVVRRRADRYYGGHPQPDDVVLVIEISDTTLAYDRGVKLAGYARAGLPETWIANLESRTGGVERYTDPDSEAGTYQRVVFFARGEEVRSEILPTLALPVDEVLGPPPPLVNPRT